MRGDIVTSSIGALRGPSFRALGSHAQYSICHGAVTISIRGKTLGNELPRVSHDGGEGKKFSFPQRIGGS